VEFLVVYNLQNLKWISQSIKPFLCMGNGFISPSSTIHFNFGSGPVITSNVEARLASHNTGQSTHTAKYRPWKITTYHAFSGEGKAAAFEKYLKSGSGRAFRSNHLV